MVQVEQLTDSVANSDTIRYGRRDTGKLSRDIFTYYEGTIIVEVIYDMNEW
jgi:hypothetical protein